MSDIRLKRITVENQLTVQNGTVRISDTTNSTNLTTAALIVSGGVTIQGTQNALNATSGGGLTVAGGISTLKSAHIGENLVVESPSSQFSVKGISQHRFLVDSTINKNIFFSPDGVNKALDITSNCVQVICSTDSLNASTGAFVVNGGIACDGKVYTNSDVLVGGTLGTSRVQFGTASSISENTNGLMFESTDDILMYGQSTKISADTFTIAEFSSDAIDLNTKVNMTDTTSSTCTNGSVVLNGGLTVLCTGDSVSTTSGGGITVNGGLAVAKSTILGDQLKVQHTNLSYLGKIVLGDTAYIGTSTGNVVYTSNEHHFRNTSSGTSTLAIINNSVIVNGQYTMSTSNGSLVVAGDQPRVNITPLLTSGSSTISVSSATVGNCVTLGYTQDKFVLETESAVGERPDLVVQNNVTFTSHGNVTVTGNVYCKSGVYNGTDNATNVSTGSVRVQGGTSIAKDAWLGGKIVLGNGNVTLDTQNAELLVSSTDHTRMKVFSSNLGAVKNTGIELYSLGFDTSNTNYEALQVSTNGTSGHVIRTVCSGTGVQRRLDLDATGLGVQLCLSTSGNVGIGTSDPGSSLDIRGTFVCSGASRFGDTTASTVSTGALRVSGGVTIHGTTNATGISSGGAITVQGGATVTKDAYFGGIVTFMSTEPSTSYGSGAVNVRGGLTISCNQAAANVGNGGALTVAGGASVGGDLWVGGSINGSGSSSSSYAYLTLTATDEAVNLTTGALVTFGGISIQCSTDSTSVTNGGSLLVRGGGSFGGGLYVDGNNFFYGTQTYVTQYSSDIFVFLDSLKMTKFSLNQDLSSKNLSIVRYDELENPIENTITLDYSTGAFIFNNTRGSVSMADASVRVVGGLSIQCSQNSTNVSSGGGLTVEGGVAVSQDMYIGGKVTICNTTASNDISSGSLVVYGGVGITGNTNIGGNTIIAGNLTVNGTTVSLETVNTVLKDNIFLLNSGPSGSRDAGISIQRYQLENDTGSGDVVQHAGQIVDTLPSQTGMGNTFIKLSASASSVNNYYQYWWIKVANGFSSNQVRKIVSYNGSTRVAEVSSAWTSQNPGIGDTVLLCNKAYVGLTFNELADRFEFGSSVVDTATNVQLTDYLDVQLGGLYTRTVSVSDGITVTSTSDATGTSSGTIVTNGGIGVAKNAYIGGDLVVGGKSLTPSVGDIFKTLTFTAGSTTSPQNVTGLSFAAGTWGFDCWLSAKLELASGLFYAHYHIRGVAKTSSWDIVRTYVGDDLGIDFTITPGGQVQYTTPNYTGFVNLFFKFRALAN
ncbi:hypothetical protein EB077_06545 [bacterium]|nr:hypothetical protein [bacterium]